MQMGCHAQYLPGEESINLNIKEQIVVITGGTRGIGAAIAELFHKSGATVIATGTEAKSISRLNTKSGGELTYKRLDFASDESVNTFLDDIRKMGRVDVLINNAGVNKIDTVDKIKTSDWDWINTVNLRGPFLLTREIASMMKAHNYGRIVNISSIFGTISKEKRAAYSTTKWGLVGLTKAVALDLAPFNILVNAVSPGFVDTELTRKILGVDEMEALRGQIPQGRLGNPEEIAQLVLFLASNANTYLTGQNIVIDGGFTSA